MCINLNKKLKYKLKKLIDLKKIYINFKFKKIFV